MNRYRSLYVLPCAISFLLLSFGPVAVFAQNKPSGKTAVTKTAPTKKVEDRRPPSEKMAEKPFTWNRKLMQNLVTRYNYYYNAKTRLQAILKTAAEQSNDNYSYLLPFYPYNPQNMGLGKNDLDSVVYKSSVAVQIHDPRGRWIDDCYLLMGRAYFYQGDLENANKTFQFINTTFAPKKKSDYKAVVGAADKDLISIASREKRKGLLGRMKHIYVRNDALLWRAKTLLEQKEYDEVQSLLSVLQVDPNFPKRLDGDLAEVQAYSRYKQGRYAEAMEPLRIAIRKNRDKKGAKARMSYILGQLYEHQQKPDSAMDQFRRVIRLKPDPMMDFQARIQIAKINATAEGGSLEQSLAALQKMSRKERYLSFRDAIYYTMGTLAATKDPEAAVGYLQKSLKMESTNPLQRTLSFNALADVYYNQRQYLNAKSYYDSTAASMPQGYVDSAVVSLRKEVLGDVAARVNAIQHEDSLQHIAAMPEADRNTFLEQLAANIKKAAQEKNRQDSINNSRDEDRSENSENSFADALDMNNNSRNRGGGAGSKEDDQGDWYFYNQGNKASGYSEFKQRWGNRALGDNWRRSQAGGIAFADNNPQANDVNITATDSTKAALPPDSMNAQALAVDLPLTPEKLKASQTIQMDAWFDLGKLYHDKLNNATLAIEAYDSLLLKFPDHPKKAEVLYSLYAWHNRLNHADQANQYKQLVLNQYGNTNFASIIRYGGVKDVDAEKKGAISVSYDSAYNAYQRGDYALALERKRQADSAHGLSHMQPKFDLLEAMAIIKSDTLDGFGAPIDTAATATDSLAADSVAMDSTALALADSARTARPAADTVSMGKKAIQAVINKYPNNEAIRSQAQAILDALNRKQELVSYLAALKLEKRDSGGTMIDEDISIRYPWQTPRPQFDSVKTATAAPVAVSGQATGATPPPMVPVKPATPYKLVADNPYFVILYFSRVSKTLMDEGLDKFTQYNANMHASEKIEVGSFVLTPSDVMLIFRLFANEDKALDYFDEIRERAPVNIIPRIRPTEYSLFVISRDNFVLLNNTKDLEGYRKFFTDNYVTQ